ncbi:3-methyladenine DNA glycosylase AlkD [Dyadobacter koreensis]|uniref:3-methyladenine DNA glycosylase AlkD n=1 Tax=Dyadobacter koreensis TaxID=408657 RepID=A0A1H6XJU4_9BACT|nr:DNA alkylation repair protein [Dyadobacter koreensis]SEJ27804.1 3-methyladenine DNA glycosylase AlkD [Dyadobacter koreensis]
MTLEETLSQLEGLGSERMREFNAKHGVGQNQFGVKMGDIRAVAKKIKTDHSLALQLWSTENIDARFLAILIMNPKKLTHEELTEMVRSEKFTHVADWLYSYVIKDYPETESLRTLWVESENVMLARAGWSLTSGCVARNPDLLDLPAILDRLESEMADSAPEVQWTMNSTLANIGIRFPEYRSRALEIGERLGIYRNYPVSKGCTSPFAPIWINEIVRRQEQTA